MTSIIDYSIEYCL